MTTLLKDIKMSDEHTYEIKYSEDDNGTLIIYDERGIKCRNKDIKFAILSEALIQSLYNLEELQHLSVKMSQALDIANTMIFRISSAAGYIEEYSKLSNEINHTLEENISE